MLKSSIIFFLSVFVCFSAVCSGAVTVEVAPKVEVLKGETAKLPCTYKVSQSSSNTVVEWYIVSNFQILLFLFQIFLDGKMFLFWHIQVISITF